jgi:hypothetical protein
MKKIIYKTIEVEVEISFPFVTINTDSKNIYFNFAENKCIKINSDTNSIEYIKCNLGFEYSQISTNDFHLNYGAILQFYFDIFNNMDK